MGSGAVPDDPATRRTVNDRWRRVEALYHEMLAYPPHERAAALSAACGEDGDLRSDVQSLLDQPDAGFPSMSAMALVASHVAFAAAVPGIGPGSRLGPYEIERLIGEGGMGRVYRARDMRLGRAVALKVCRHGFGRQFEREARSIAALNHSHVCTLYDVGPDYLVMELLEGETLATVVERGPQPIEDVLRNACAIADALAAAHAIGIVHRDLKPGNVMFTPTGVKVLDFGLATQAPTPDDEGVTAEASESAAQTLQGHIIGTVAYMSPEQAEGRPADRRSDVFAFGVLLYEMLCGTRPFTGSSTVATLAATIHDTPTPPRRIRKEIPHRLERIVMHCLAKRADDRYPSGRELHRDLAGLLPARAAVHRGRSALIGAGLALVASAVALGSHRYIQASRATWVERQAAPAIAQLITENRRLAALNLYRQATSYVPDSPALVTVAEGLVAQRLTVQSTPSGARVYISDYMAHDASNTLTEWQFLGETPFETDQLPMWGYYRIRAMKDGFASVDRAFFPLDVRQLDLPLQAQPDVPPRMVWVPGGASTSPAPAVLLPGYWIDTFEVSNREFKAFVDAGGYTTERYWTEPLVKEGHVLSWVQALQEFRDLSGRFGPAGWQLGTYPEGSDDIPVTGVSWYEALAYATFAGKQLPTVYEWYGAAGANGGISDILPASNFGGRGPAPVGVPRGMARYGSYDMAGNVKEWVANAREDRRYALGGAWDDPPYMFIRVDAKPPFTRDPTTGFRLVKRLGGASDEMLRPVTFGPYTSEQQPPVDDDAFQILRRLHAYDPTDLDAKIERTVELPYGRRETVTFRAAYGAERVVAHLFLPNTATPPFQIVAFFGHSGIFGITRIEDLQLPYEFVVRTGRALIIPAYNGSLERGPTPFILPPAQTRDRAVKWSMDLGRSIDYLQTRPDIDIDKLAYYGVSLGAAEGPRLVSLEARFKAAVLSTGGLRDPSLPEIYGLNFAPRVHIPVLMLNGRDDFIYPPRTHQMPLFDALGTQAPDKVFKLYDVGHANFLTRPDVIGLILEWFDQYLGTVGPPDTRSP